VVIQSGDSLHGKVEKRIREVLQEKRKRTGGRRRRGIHRRRRNHLGKHAEMADLRRAISSISRCLEQEEERRVRGGIPGLLIDSLACVGG
jgi:hypothetical protein